MNTNTQQQWIVSATTGYVELAWTRQAVASEAIATTLVIARNRHELATRSPYRWGYYLNDMEEATP